MTDVAVSPFATQAASLVAAAGDRAMWTRVPFSSVSLARRLRWRSAAVAGIGVLVCIFGLLLYRSLAPQQGVWHLGLCRRPGLLLSYRLLVSAWLQGRHEQST